MLILSRKVGEKIAIGDNVTIVVNRISGNRVALGIHAPKDVRVVRGELERFVEEFDDPSGEGQTVATAVPSSVMENLTADTYVPRNAR